MTLGLQMRMQARPAHLSKSKSSREERRHAEQLAEVGAGSHRVLSSSLSSSFSSSLSYSSSSTISDSSASSSSNSFSSGEKRPDERKRRSTSKPLYIAGGQNTQIPPPRKLSFDHGTATPLSPTTASSTGRSDLSCKDVPDLLQLFNIFQFNTPETPASRMLVNISLVGSIHPIRLLVAYNATVQDVIRASLKAYGKEGRVPRHCYKHQSYGLHYSPFCLECQYTSLFYGHYFEPERLIDSIHAFVEDEVPSIYSIEPSCRHRPYRECM